MLSCRGILFLSSVLFFCSCGFFKSSDIIDTEAKEEFAVKDTLEKTTAPADTFVLRDTFSSVIDISQLEQDLINAGLVNIIQLDSNINVDLRYSTENNFLGTDVYEALENCYLQPEVAEKLVKAQQLLKEENSGYNLLVYDGVRPRSIQQKMWELLDMPFKEKIKYVSNPALGSLHNFGAAVDVSIMDEDGKELDMGTAFDFFGELAFPIKEKQFLSEGKLSQHQVENRKLLRRVMYGAGFFNIQTEWWHFNSCYRKEAASKYSLIE